MKLCSSCLGAVCDFCVWYVFNGGYFGPPEEEVDRGRYQVYVGDGFCRIDGRAREPEEGCGDFVCGNWQKEVNMVGSPWEVEKMRLARGMWEDAF